MVHEATAALCAFGPIEITVLPGVEEDIGFRWPSELLDVRPGWTSSLAAS
jgi:hypothetical protein